MSLAINDHAPPFEAATWDGKTLTLDQFTGNRVWLAFFRYASCPLCNLRVHDMIKRQAEWDAARLQIIAVFQSPAESVAKYVGKQNPPFPIVCDPREQLYKAYGLEASTLGYVHPGNLPIFARAAREGFLPGRMEGTLTRIPGDFLIRAEGTLHDVFYGKLIGDHIPFERVEAFLQAGVVQ